MSKRSIGPAVLQEKIANGVAVELLDVRTPKEYEDTHIMQARNTPLDTIDPARIVQERSGSASEPLYLICKSGMRAGQAYDRFVRAGFENVMLVEGGMVAWEQSGLPVLRGRKCLPVDSQVRMTAGSMVLLGVLLGSMIHPWFNALAGFVGAGLVFAGITDNCPLANLIARMPWNRSCPTGSCTAR